MPDVIVGDQEAFDVTEVGTPIEITGDVAQLRAELDRLVTREASLYQQGVGCPIKERDDTTCSACPIKAAVGELAALCSVGCEQERVATTLAILHRDEPTG